MSNFLIKSKINNYNLFFLTNSKIILKKLSNNNHYFIVDTKVYKKFKLEKILKKNIIKINPNENIKEYKYIYKILKKLINKNISKESKIIAIGGGITQDVCSFISLILFRGLKWYYFPTTLLSMGDSCIGSKLSVNLDRLKNQIGGYYPPEKIFIDEGYLDTLPKKDLISGIGEMYHYFLVSSERDYKDYEKNLDSLINGDKVTINKFIKKSLKIKKKFIENDEFEKNKRKLLNYGHTFGHALESYYNYKLPHGVAIAYGMGAANYLSYKKHYITYSKFLSIQLSLLKITKFFKISDLNINKYFSYILKDKKTINGIPSFILTRGPGKMFIEKNKIDKKIKKYIQFYFLNEV